MNLSNEILEAQFSKEEIEALKIGYSLPTGSLGIDRLIMRRFSRSTLGKICLIAADEKSMPHSFGEFGNSASMNIYSLLNDYPLNDSWSIHVDVGTLDDGKIEEKPIPNPNSILAVEICLTPKVDLNGALDDYGYEGQQFIRSEYFYDWSHGTASPIEEQIELLHTLDQKIS